MVDLTTNSTTENTCASRSAWTRPHVPPRSTLPEPRQTHSTSTRRCRCAMRLCFMFSAHLWATPSPLNEGCFKPLKVIAPEGSMVNAQYPSAVIAGNTEVSQLACNALLGALGVMAGSQATMNNYVWGNARIQNYETICGGTGAGPDFDGCSAVQTHMTNTRSNRPRDSRVPFSGAAGRDVDPTLARAGRARIQAVTGSPAGCFFKEQMTVTTLCSHRRVPPFRPERRRAG